MTPAATPSHQEAATREDIALLVRERQLQLAFENARFAIFPLVISALCYTSLLAGVVSRDQLTLWLLAMLALIGIRTLLALGSQSASRDLNRDVDRFRAYNERYGHHAGDLCLARLARLIADLADRDGDLVARFGGEEFALLLPNTASDAERVVTASCGVATLIPDTTQRAEELVEAIATSCNAAMRTRGRAAQVAARFTHKVKFI